MEPTSLSGEVSRGAAVDMTAKRLRRMMERKCMAMVIWQGLAKNAMAWFQNADVSFGLEDGASTDAEYIAQQEVALRVQVEQRLSKISDANSTGVGPMTEAGKGVVSWCLEIQVRVLNNVHRQVPCASK